MASAVGLRVTVPVCGLRKGTAREYLETDEVPPPSTLYGFLLSLVGEEDRTRYVGTRLACALLTKPAISTVLRTVWRVKTLKESPGVGVNRRPDYQELLTGLEFALWVEEGELCSRLDQAARDPSAVSRFGGLSLGESRDLVNDIDWNPDLASIPCRWLRPDGEGDLPLPVWVDHVGSRGTIWKQFRLEGGQGVPPAPDSPYWISIVRPPADEKAETP